MSTPIICAGFHRSGTSLASQIIHLSGIPYAIEPMGGNISNPDGHFEDVQAMRMHDLFLAKSGTSWKYFGEKKITNKHLVIQRIKEYSNCRKKIDGPLWLMKDPRATLFLEEWDSALLGKVNFVLMFRHWGLCVQSLLKRSSRDMLSNLGEQGLINDNLSFWKDIELSARMWLAYNKRLIAYYELNSDKCLLVPQELLLDSYDLIGQINSKFHLNLPVLKKSPVKTGYSSESIESIIFDSLPLDLIDELDKTFSDLCELANVNLSIVEKNLSIHTNTEKSIYLKLKSNQEKCLELPKPIVQDLARLKKSIESEELALILSEFKKFNLFHSVKFTQSLVPFLEKILDLHPFNFDLQELAGRIYLFLGQSYKSQEHFFKALSLNGRPPYLRMLIAESYMLRFDFDLAEFYCLMAHHGNSKNPQFLIKLGELNSFKKEYSSSIEYYQKSLELNEQDWIKCKISDVVNLDQGVTSAIKTINYFLSHKKSEVLSDKLIRFECISDAELARSSFRNNIRDIITPDLITDFLDVVKNNCISEVGLNNLLFWFSKQILSLFSESEIESLLSHEKGEPLESHERTYPNLIKQSVKKIRPISFVVVKFSDELNFNFRKSLDVYKYSNQIIEVDNTSNLFFDNLGRAIKFGVDQAVHDIIAVIHEDVLLVENWQSNFEKSISQLERVDENWGMLGAVGWDNKGHISGHWSDPHQYANTFESEHSYSEVIKLDEQLLIFHRNRLPNFDTSLPSIHHLGSDLRMQLFKNKFKTYVVNAPTIHKYADSSGKLVLSKNDSSKIQDRMSKTYLADKAICDRYIQVKWPKETIPHCMPLERFDLKGVAESKREQLNSPIILLSRGGSGSRLSSLLVQDLGVFLGHDVTKSGDSMDLLPAVYQGLVTKYRTFTKWQYDEIVPRLKRIALNMLSDLPVDTVWGFKLPETLFLLPEMRKAFPNARYVHFLRDPLTTTLRRTHMTARLDNHIGRISLPLAYDYLGISRSKILVDSPALHMANTTIHQLNCILEHVECIDADKIIEVRYEDILSNPAFEVDRLSKFLALEVKNNLLESSVDINRSTSPSIKYAEEIELEVQDILEGLRRKLNYI